MIDLSTFENIIIRMVTTYSEFYRVQKAIFGILQLFRFSKDLYEAFARAIVSAFPKEMEVYLILQ